MRKLFWIVSLLTASSQAYCQSQNGLADANKTLGTLKVSENNKEEALNEIIKSPVLYNGVWDNYIKSYLTNKWGFLNNLDITFKSFQTEDNPVASLGFAYDLSFDFAKYTEGDTNGQRFSHTFGLATKGNVAFNRQINPIDFLESKAKYNFSWFIGGVKETKNTDITDKVNALTVQLASMSDPESDAAKALWRELGQSIVLKNQYYFSVEPKYALESNQNFSKVQFAPGITFGLGAKAWNNKTLAHFNLFDYPFAFLRLLTGTDKKFTPYGATIPSIQAGIDYVDPKDDSDREKLTGNKNAFPRFKFETGFRTFITKIKKESIFFNSNFRYYREINAPQSIRDASLASQPYLVLALQSTSGLYASYGYGKLPFDAKNDKIYSIGFDFKLK